MIPHFAGRWVVCCPATSDLLDEHTETRRASKQRRLAALGALLRQELGASVHRGGVGHGDVQHRPEFKHRTYKSVDLYRLSSLYVLQHRSLVVADLLRTCQPLASMAGLRVLMEGGNAFDAAVAIAATLNVGEPYMSGVGFGRLWR